MAGGIIFVLVMVFVLPPLVLFGGAIWSAIFGVVSSKQTDAEPDAAPQ